MDSVTYNRIYGGCVTRFRNAANAVSMKEHTGVWPVKREPARIMLLYVWALVTSQDPNTPLTDAQIMAINTRVNNLKYV